MFHALYAIVSVGFAAVWTACYHLGGQTARMVLTGGLYRLHPAYRPLSGPNRLLRGHPDHRERRPDFAVDQLADFWPTPAVANVPAPAVAATSLVVHAELDDEHTGAEHWDTLLTDMTTEEREIYNLEMYQTHEQLMDIQREMYARSDDWFAQLMDRWSADTEAVTCGSRGWDTGMWHLYDAKQPRIPEELLV